MKYNYYGVIEERWTSPPENFTGSFESRKFNITVHYRANELDVEKYEKGQWIKINK